MLSIVHNQVLHTDSLRQKNIDLKISSQQEKSGHFSTLKRRAVDSLSQRWLSSLLQSAFLRWAWRWQALFSHIYVINSRGPRTLPFLHVTVKNEESMYFPLYMLSIGEKVSEPAKSCAAKYRIQTDARVITGKYNRDKKPRP